MASENLDKNWSKLIFKVFLKHLQKLLSISQFISGSCHGNQHNKKGNEITRSKWAFHHFMQNEQIRGRTVPECLLYPKQ